MGHSKRRTSVTGQSGSEDAGQQLAQICSENDAAEAVEFAAQVYVATMPNGQAKNLIYSGAKHTTMFAIRARRDGYQQAAEQTSTNIATSTGASVFADGVMDQVSKEAVSKGTNKSLTEPTRAATEKSLSLMMEKGADALNDRRQ